MRRADIPGISTLISCCNNDRDAFLVCICDTLLDIFIVLIGTKAEIDHLCAFVYSVANAIADSRGMSVSGGIHDTYRKNLYINPGRAVYNDACHMSTMTVAIRRIAVVVHIILARQNPSLKFSVIGYTAVYNSDSDSSLGVCPYKSGVLVRLYVRRAP